VLKHAVLYAGDGVEEVVAKLAAEHSPYLCNLFDRRQSIEPGHQGIL
jgi:hypothetical protein